jgi:flavin reductase (DIM6/NTAB) family NADH-FMN oxidoreductase RutF
MAEATRKLTSGVYVITSKKADGSINGLAAAWVVRVSFDPNLVAVSIGNKRHTLSFVKESNAFAVNILGEGQQEIAKRFGLKSGRNVDKFAGIEHFTAKTGCPVLKDAIAYMDCKVVKSLKAGDHTLFIGEVAEEKVQRDTPPLVYRAEEYWK